MTYSLAFKESLIKKVLPPERRTVRAVLFKAKLVILDEPTEGLSANGVERILEFTEGMKKEGISLTIISRVFPQIFPITDRFVIVSRGSILEEKSKDETIPRGPD
jgi:simple sugar transport system ATP-binding protein